MGEGQKEGNGKIHTVVCALGQRVFDSYIRIGYIRGEREGHVLTWSRSLARFSSPSSATCAAATKAELTLIPPGQ